MLLHVSYFLPSSGVKINMDVCDLLNGGDLLVVIDDYNRYPEVKIITTTSASAIIPKLNNIVSFYGILAVVKSDNDLSFQSLQFA